jgi:peptidoglycan LD-endopeptidase CwlK
MINVPIFSEFSKKNLLTCHPDLRQIAEAAIARIDFMVTEGHRNKEKQEEAFLNKTTKVHYPNSMHNTFPSLAFDFVPFPFGWTDKDWNDIKRFQAVRDILAEEAGNLGIEILWGGAWGWDSPHIELISRGGVKYSLTYIRE